MSLLFLGNNSSFTRIPSSSITPNFGGWATSPTNLNLALDDNPSTGTTFGITSATATPTGNPGAFFQYDFGQVRSRILIEINFVIQNAIGAAWNATGDWRVTASNTGMVYYSLWETRDIFPTEEDRVENSISAMVCVGNTRYVRFNTIPNGSGALQTRIREFRAWQLNIM